MLVDDPEETPPRTVGLRDLLLLSVGGMIGSAVFFPGFTGQLVGPTAVVVWLVVGLGMVAIALCYAELATMFPESGGLAVFPTEILRPS